MKFVQGEIRATKAVPVALEAEAQKQATNHAAVGHHDIRLAGVLRGEAIPNSQHAIAQGIERLGPWRSEIGFAPHPSVQGLRPHFVAFAEWPAAKLADAALVKFRFDLQRHAASVRDWFGSFSCAAHIRTYHDHRFLGCKDRTHVTRLLTAAITQADI